MIRRMVQGIPESLLEYLGLCLFISFEENRALYEPERHPASPRGLLPFLGWGTALSNGLCPIRNSPWGGWGIVGAIISFSLRGGETALSMCFALSKFASGLGHCSSDEGFALIRIRFAQAWGSFGRLWTPKIRVGLGLGSFDGASPYSKFALALFAFFG